jgi:microcystin-dependent protein
MADTVTPNLGLTKPEIGASADSWGNKINADLDILDTKIVYKTNQWNVVLGDGNTAAGHFVVTRYNNSAIRVDDPLIINRQTGDVSVVNNLVVGGSAQAVVHKFPYTAPPAAPVVGIANFFVDGYGNPCIQRSDGSIQYLGVPPGTIAWTCAGSTDVGWALCNGQAISRTLNPALFAKIGGGYGAGDGSTTFNIPDIRGRTIAHQDLGAGILGNIIGTTLNAKAGAEIHYLTAGQMPSHTHTGTTDTANANHNHGYNEFQIDGASPSLQGGAPYTWRAVGGTTSDAGADHTHTFTTNGTGGGNFHSNMQPTIILNAQIKLG